VLLLWEETLVRIDYRVVFPESVGALRDLDLQAQTVLFDRKLIELTRLRVSQLNGCPHCIRLYADNASIAGENFERLMLLRVWQDTAVFDRRERAALRWSEVLTTLPMTGSSEEAFEDVKAHFSDKEVVALTVAILAVNSWNRLHLGLGDPSGAASQTRPILAGHDTSLSPRARALLARLEDLEAEIASARTDYRRVAEGPPGPRFYETGTIHPELDDPAIVPPG
jgi:AhpD family alkylhydroperoxidase